MMPLKTSSLNIKPQLKQWKSSQGFTLIEVVVAALLTIVLTGVAMQTIVFATMVRVKAQESSEATNWIQQDYEDIKILANGEDMGYCPTGSTSTGCTGISNNYITNTSKCNAVNAGSGYGKDLQDLVGVTEDITKASKIGQRPYVVRRVTSVVDAAPSMLKVTYSVYRGTDTTSDPMNTFYAEVVPGAAFSCR
jgi:type II secretory pathway pseudopilin PulG